MKEVIQVLVKHPGVRPFLCTVPNDLEPLQKLVGGYIETVTISTDLVVICNEEGRLMGLPYNCTIMGTSFVGTIIIAGREGCEFDDVGISYNTAQVLFPQLWEVESC